MKIRRRMQMRTQTEKKKQERKLLYNFAYSENTLCSPMQNLRSPKKLSLPWNTWSNHWVIWIVRINNNTITRRSNYRYGSQPIQVSGSTEYKLNAR